MSCPKIPDAAINTKQSGIITKLMAHVHVSIMVAVKAMQIASTQNISVKRLVVILQVKLFCI